MNNKILFLPLVCLALIACERNDGRPVPPPGTQTHYNADNTAKNVRDTNQNAVTPFDQSETEADRMVSQRIRQDIVKDDTLSTNAKNVKVVTNNGVVHLRGPVNSPDEKAKIGKIVENVSGVKSVNNQLEVVR